MAHHLPEEAYQLAACFRLGIPLKQYLRRSLYPSQFLIDIICLAIMLGMLWTFVFSEGFSFAHLIALLAALATRIKEDCSTFLLFPIFLIVAHIPGSAYYAYECSEGFVEINRITGSVRSVHWNTVRRAHIVLHRGDKGWSNIYYVTTTHDQEVAVPYWGMWLYCRKLAKENSESLTTERLTRKRPSQVRRSRRYHHRRRDRRR